MSMVVPQSGRRPRRHGVTLEPADRRALERAGWRTTLDYREDHVRGRDGRLVEVVPTWIAEAERYSGQVVFASACGTTIDEAWAQLRADVETQLIDDTPRVRLVPR